MHSLSPGEQPITNRPRGIQTYVSPSVEFTRYCPATGSTSTFGGGTNVTFTPAPNCTG